MNIKRVDTIDSIFGTKKWLAVILTVATR